MYHDTQGICIQNEVPITSSTTTSTTSSAPTTADASSSGHNIPATTTMDTHSTSVKTRNKRSLEVPNIELEPVRKKPKISHFSFDVKTMDKPINYQTCVARDVAWIVSCKTNKQTPMWSG